jgi:hypothetical protein
MERGACDDHDIDVDITLAETDRCFIVHLEGGGGIVVLLLPCHCNVHRGVGQDMVQILACPQVTFVPAMTLSDILHILVTCLGCLLPKFMPDLVLVL